MKFLITGASGVLGSALVDEVLSRKFEFNSVGYNDLLSADFDKLIRLLAEHDVIIHAAANTNVEECELYPDACYRDNFLLTERLAYAASLSGCKMTFVSSTGVYGNAKNEPFKEYDMVDPSTHHHKSKLLAEIATQSASIRNLIVRIGWLFGGSYISKKNFVARRADEGFCAVENNLPIQCNSSQWGVPCFNRDIAARILELILRDATGIFNCVNEGFSTRFNYVGEIFRLLEIKAEIQPVNSSEFIRFAKVSNNEMAVNWKMNELGLCPMPFWQDSLAKYINTELKYEIN